MIFNYLLLAARGAPVEPPASIIMAPNLPVEFTKSGNIPSLHQAEWVLLMSSGCGGCGLQCFGSLWSSVVSVVKLIHDVCPLG